MATRETVFGKVVKLEPAKDHSAVRTRNGSVEFVVRNPARLTTIMIGDTIAMRIQEDRTALVL